MKDRTKCILLFFFFFIIIFLAIYIIKRTPKCDRIHADEMIAFDVPDADIAKQIADVVMDIGEDKDYDVNVDFDEKSNEWIITYVPNCLEGDGDTLGQKIVKIRKDIGTITINGD